MPKPKKVLILGAGYAAIRIVMSLRQAIYAGEIEVTIVSRSNHHAFHGFVSEMLTGRISPHLFTSPWRRIFKPAHLILAEIEAVDLTQQTVTIRRDVDQQVYQLGYDHLAVTVGSATRLDHYGGTEIHGFDIKNYENCLRLRYHLLHLIEAAVVEPDEAERRRLLTFVVIGGGYAGSEVSGELADFQKLLQEQDFKQLNPADFKVILVHSGPQILPQYSSGPGANGYGNGHPAQVVYATRHLEKDLGVEIRCNSRVVAITEREVVLESGEVIPTYTAITTVGIKAPALVELLPLEREPTLGRIIVNQTLQVPGYNNVWAAGDCAAVPHPAAGVCPPVGVYATFGGQELGRNILRYEHGQPLKNFTHPGLGQAVSLGRRAVAGEIWGLYTRGFLGWLIAWRLGLIYFIPTWDRKWRLIADWFIWPFVGRDITAGFITRPSDHTIHRLLFAAGEQISASPTSYWYFIFSGTVRQESAGQPAVVLQPGSVFNSQQHTFWAETEVWVARFTAGELEKLLALKPFLQLQQEG